MRNPYEAEPAEEPRVCATCARYFDFDRMCNVPEAVEKLLRERFGIVLGGSEFAVEPEKITDCAAWVSARLIDRYALLRAKQDLSLIHISEPTRLGMISYAVFCLKARAV